MGTDLEDRSQKLVVIIDREEIVGNACTVQGRIFNNTSLMYDCKVEDFTLRDFDGGLCDNWGTQREHGQCSVRPGSGIRFFPVYAVMSRSSMDERRREFSLVLSSSRGRETFSCPLVRGMTSLGPFDSLPETLQDRIRAFHW